MAKQPIVTLPHSVLRERALAIRPEEIQDAKIQRLIADMQETLATAQDGVGLAAPQIGVSLRIFLVSDDATHIDKRQESVSSEQEAEQKRQWEYFVFINPVLKKRSRQKRTLPEGCLSVPGKFGEVSRSEKVLLEWYDEHGRKHTRGFTKFFARVIQHELDHLDGVLITDRAKKLIAMPKDTSRGTTND